MHAKDYALILASWTRVPVATVGAAIDAARRASLIPSGQHAIEAEEAAIGLISLLALGFEGRSGLPARIATVCGMSLEAPDGSDPLDLMPRQPFQRLVGETAAANSANGYLTLSETLASALRRHENNAGTIELGRVGIRVWGDAWVGFLEAREGDETHTWHFTTGGMPTVRRGLLRETFLSAEIMSGVSFILEAEAARRGSRVTG